MTGEALAVTFRKAVQSLFVKCLIGEMSNNKKFPHNQIFNCAQNPKSEFHQIALEDEINDRDRKNF